MGAFVRPNTFTHSRAKVSAVTDFTGMSSHAPEKLSSTTRIAMCPRWSVGDTIRKSMLTSTQGRAGMDDSVSSS